MRNGQPGVRGRYAKGDERREAIIDVATEIFGTVGYRAATILQIAAACGISRAGLLHHFPTKEGLLQAVLARRDETNRLLFPLPDSCADPGQAELRQLVDVMRSNATSPTIVNLFSVLSAEAGDPRHPAHSYFAERYQELRESLERVLRGLAEQGGLVAGTEPIMLAAELVALMDGLQVQWVLAPDRIDMPAILEHRINSALVEPLG